MNIHESAEDYLEAILILRERQGAVRSIDVVRQLELTKPKSAQLTALLAEVERQVSGRLAQAPRQGAKVLRALKAVRENAVFNPGAGHTLGLLAVMCAEPS